MVGLFAGDKVAVDLAVGENLLELIGVFVSADIADQGGIGAERCDVERYVSRAASPGVLLFNFTDGDGCFWRDAVGVAFPVAIQGDIADDEDVRLLVELHGGLRLFQLGAVYQNCGGCGC